MVEEVAHGFGAETGSRTRWLTTLALVVALVVVVVVAAYVWSGPRRDVPTPGPEATPEEVVTAYVEALEARDFATANAIDARPRTDLGRFSRPGTIRIVRFDGTSRDGGRVHVAFTADFEGGDGTLEDGSWGYVLERGEDGRWHIVDAGVG